MPNSSLRQTVLICVLLVLAVFFVTTFRLGVVTGESMLPTYQDGQMVLVNRRFWRHTPIKRGDVVLVRKDRDVLIKRIACLPGEEITDPELLARAYTGGLADYYEQPIPAAAGRRPRLFVPENFYVVLGDNRPASDDSRAFGPVPEHDVLGVVVASPPPPAGDKMPGPPRRADALRPAPAGRLF